MRIKAKTNAQARGGLSVGPIKDWLVRMESTGWGEMER
jgi:hypothetical protein